MTPTAPQVPREERALPVGTDPDNAKLHKRIERFCYVLLVGLVIEGAFTLPFMVIYYGWPTLSISQICDQLDRVMYNDDSRSCETEPFYGPPFGGKSSGEDAKTAEDGGTIVQPDPGYDKIGWRELIKLYEASEAKNKAAAEKARERSSGEASDQPQE